jgi:ammonia channel protein AmtB
LSPGSSTLALLGANPRSHSYGFPSCLWEWSASNGSSGKCIDTAELTNHILTTYSNRGYSLAFSHNANFFIGNLDNIGFRNVLGAPSIGSAKIPDLLFAVYQGMFACITVALAVGAVAERGRMLPCVVFMFVWSTVVYDPIACWTWNPNGWAAKMGGLDFAGGTPVHIASG